MFGRRHYPAGYGTGTGIYAPALFNPFRGLLGGSLMIAGILVIMNMLAPQLLEHALPDWKLRYGGIIVAAVILGFLRSIFRMILPLAALGFWIIAMFALVHTSAPTWFSLPNIPAVSTRASQSQDTTTPPSTTIHALHGSKSLPDSAYFPAHESSGTSALSNIPGVSWLRKLFR
ncbi:MAG: hypothetical protein RL518_1148 [Pseudomonadota bacterium]|jgi:hypothetical protein